MPVAGKTGCQINQANVKVSRANAQSRPGGILMAAEKKKQHQDGRKPKADQAVFRYSVSFNAEEHAKFLSRFERKGAFYCYLHF
jgi:hypothetical protein